MSPALRSHVRIARSQLAVVTVAIAVVLLAASCGGGSSGSTSDTTLSTNGTPNIPGTAKIDTLDVVPSVQCGGKTSTTVQVHYATSGAAKQLLRVDGRDVPGTDAPTGTLNAPVHCDALPHTVVLFAFDSRGHRTVLQRMMITQQ